MVLKSIALKDFSFIKIHDVIQLSHIEDMVVGSHWHACLDEFGVSKNGHVFITLALAELLTRSTFLTTCLIERADVRANIFKTFMMKTNFGMPLSAD